MFLRRKSIPARLCFLCPHWVPIPGQDERGVCQCLDFPNNRTMEHDACHLNHEEKSNLVLPIFSTEDMPVQTV